MVGKTVSLSIFNITYLDLLTLSKSLNCSKYLSVSLSEVSIYNIPSLGLNLKIRYTNIEPNITPNIKI